MIGLEVQLWVIAHGSTNYKNGAEILLSVASPFSLMRLNTFTSALNLILSPSYGLNN